MPLASYAAISGLPGQGSPAKVCAAALAMSSHKSLGQELANSEWAPCLRGLAVLDTISLLYVVRAWGMSENLLCLMALS